jgi:hypothetical protein
MEIRQPAPFALIPATSEQLVRTIRANPRNPWWLVTSDRKSFEVGIETEENKRNEESLDVRSPEIASCLSRPSVQRIEIEMEIETIPDQATTDHGDLHG